jgi:hypothetical protein
VTASDFLHYEPGVANAGPPRIGIGVGSSSGEPLDHSRMQT